MQTTLMNSVVYSTTVNISTTTRVYENAAPVTLLFIFGVCGNAIALIVLCCSTKTHKWRPFYRFVCGLAISDGGGILLSYPFAVSRYATHFTFTFSKRLCDYLAFVFMFTLMSSAMIVCCMSFDRFFATFFPFLYNTPNKIKRTNILIGIIWLSASLLSCLHIFGLGSSRNFYPGSWCFLDFIEKSASQIAYAYLYSIVGVIIVITTIIVNVLVIIFFIKHSLGKKTRIKKDLHVIVFLLMVVTVFTSCWMPLMINILQHATNNITKNKEGETELNLLRFGVLNSVIDPWIYILFRKEVLSLILHCVGKVIGRDLDLMTDTTPPCRGGSVNVERSSSAAQRKDFLPITATQNHVYDNRENVTGV